MQFDKFRPFFQPSSGLFDKETLNSYRRVPRNCHQGYYNYEKMIGKYMPDYSFPAHLKLLKAVTDTSYRLNVIPEFAQLLPYANNMHIHAAVGNYVFISPGSIDQLVPGEYPAGPFCHIAQ